jgi:hypothetical protein
MDKEIYIHSHTTGRYLDNDGNWSTRRSNGRQFPTISEARDWCVQENVTNAEILVVRDALVCMRVPLGEFV